MGHSARHAAEEIEFLGLEDLRFEADLVDRGAHRFDEAEEQLEFTGSVELAIAFGTDEEEAVGIAIGAEGEAEIDFEFVQLGTDLFVREAFFGDGVDGVEGEKVWGIFFEVFEEDLLTLALEGFLLLGGWVDANFSKSLRGIVGDDELIVLQAEASDEEIMKVIGEDGEIILAGHAIDEAFGLILLFEAITEEMSFPFFQAFAGKKFGEKERRGDRAEHKDDEGEGEGGGGEGVGEDGDAEEETAGDDEEEAEADDLSGGEGEIDSGVEELVLEDPVSDDHDVEDGGEATVGVNGLVGEGIMINADDGQEVIDAEEGEEGLGVEDWGDLLTLEDGH